MRTLFEANYFNRLTRQHRTNDEHFRMDLIEMLKLKSDKAADYMLEKLEDFLMGISK